MKIIHILLGKANPNTMNGVNKVVYNLAEAQVSLGHEVTVCALSNNPKITYKHSFDIKVFPVTRSKFFLHPQLKHFIKNISPDTLCHFHSVFIPPYFAISRCLVRQGIKYVFTPHGQFNKQSLSKNFWLKQLYILLVEKHILFNAHKIHATGKAEVDEILKVTKNKSIYYCPNGYSIDKNRIKARSHNTTSIIFCACSRLAIPQKGLDLLLQGFYCFKNSYKGRKYLKLNIIGDGDDKNQLVKMVAQLGLTKEVVFHGTLFGDEKFKVLMASDCFISPSRWEGFPTSVLEALSLNLPVILSKKTNMAEYVLGGNAGYVCRLTKEDIALQMSNFATYGNALSPAVNIITNKLNWYNIAKQHLHVYEK